MVSIFHSPYLNLIQYNELATSRLWHPFSKKICGHRKRFSSLEFLAFHHHLLVHNSFSINSKTTHCFIVSLYHQLKTTKKTMSSIVSFSHFGHLCSFCLIFRLLIVHSGLLISSLFHVETNPRGDFQ